MHSSAFQIPPERLWVRKGLPNRAKTCPHAGSRRERALQRGDTVVAYVPGICLRWLFSQRIDPHQLDHDAFRQWQNLQYPLAATLGLPLYINTETSLPLIRAMLDSGMSQGAALAFMTVGAGTSIGAIAGALTIARWRVVGLVVGVLWMGAILCGYAFDLLLMLKIF